MREIKPRTFGEDFVERGLGEGVLGNVYMRVSNDGENPYLVGQIWENPRGDGWAFAIRYLNTGDEKISDYFLCKDDRLLTSQELINFISVKQS